MMVRKKEMQCHISGCWMPAKYYRVNRSTGEETPDIALCPACYAGIRKWGPRSAKDILQRRKQVQRLDTRMSTMQPWVVLMKATQKERARKIAAKMRLAKNATRVQMVGKTRKLRSVK